MAIINIPDYYSLADTRTKTNQISELIGDWDGVDITFPGQNLENVVETFDHIKTKINTDNENLELHSLILSLAVS